jgi:signal peptidase I
MRARAVVVRVSLVALAATATVWAAVCFAGVYIGGDSMSPALVRGDFVIARRAVGAIHSGQIVLVDKPGWPSGVVHRVVAVDFDGGVRLKGDANQMPDFDAVPRGSVRGVVVLVVPTGRVLAVLDALGRMVQSRLA